MWPPLDHVFDDLFRLSIAYVLALPIGWNREREARSAGLRTFPIVLQKMEGHTLGRLRAHPGEAGERLGERGEARRGPSRRARWARSHRREPP